MDRANLQGVCPCCPHSMHISHAKSAVDRRAEIRENADGKSHGPREPNAVNAISPEFNRLILAFAPRDFEAREVAPDTLAKLLSATAATGRLIVWSGESENTIHGDAKVNHAFRAWHDSAHVRGRFAFDLDGERAACEFQVREVLTRFPRIPAALIRMLRAEIIGQAEFFAEHGSFPQDQVAFFRQYTGT